MVTVYIVCDYSNCDWFICLLKLWSLLEWVIQGVLYVHIGVTSFMKSQIVYFVHVHLHAISSILKNNFQKVWSLHTSSLGDDLSCASKAQRPWRWNYCCVWCVTLSAVLSNYQFPMVICLDSSQKITSYRMFDPL